MIGIIGAMDDEVNMLKKKITDPAVTKLAGCDFVCGHIGDVMVCVVQCSPGKVNAALCAQALADNFSPDCIINVGVGCSLSDDVIIKNIVVATDVCQYDIDITALGEPKGFINGINTVKIPTDPQLSEALAQTAINCGERIHRGTVATGDTFIASEKMKERLSRDFGAICGEMEGGAIGHVCAANNIPFAVVRSISDGGDENALMDYPTFKKIAAEMSTAIMVKFIKTQKTQLSLF